MRKLDDTMEALEQRREAYRWMARDASTGKESAEARRQVIGTQQVMVYTMVGGGLLGRAAAEQPEDFYIDLRVGRLPYGRREIMQAVKVLAEMARTLGFDPRNMPALPPFHGSGIF